MRKWFLNWLNARGLFTFTQYAEVLEDRGALREYAHHLERCINGMPDPAKPIIVIGQRTSVRDIRLQHGQQVIVSPYARFTNIQNVMTLPSASKERKHEND